MQDGCGVCGCVLENVALNIQVFPADENFNGAKFERPKCVFDAKAVLASVLRDLIKV